MSNCLQVRWRNAIGLVLLLTNFHAIGQHVVPFVSGSERLMAFHDRRFHKVDDRPPLKAWSMGTSMLFQDQEGRLVQFTPARKEKRDVEHTRVPSVQVSGPFAAWMVRDTVKEWHAGMVSVVATGVSRAVLSGALLAFEDTTERALKVRWQGTDHRLAPTVNGEEGVRWSAGGDALAFVDSMGRSVQLFRNGTSRKLMDGGLPMLALGTDLLAYWDGTRKAFMGEVNGAEKRLSTTEPVSAKAGHGVLAFVDGSGRLKYWDGSVVFTLTEEPPTQYWVKDGLVLYLERGALMVVRSNGPEVVCEVVPEQWEVDGDLLVYLNENRELHAIQGQERFRIGKEAAIDGFSLYGDAVQYRSPTGSFVVVVKGRSYTY